MTACGRSDGALWEMVSEKFRSTYAPGAFVLNRVFEGVRWRSGGSRWHAGRESSAWIRLAVATTSPFVGTHSIFQTTTIMFFGLWASAEEPEPKRIPLPLQTLDKCSVCESQRKLRLCANCGEVRDLRRDQLCSGRDTYSRGYPPAIILLKPMSENRLASTQKDLW